MAGADHLISILHSGGALRVDVLDADTRTADPLVIALRVKRLRVGNETALEFAPSNKILITGGDESENW